MSLDFDRETAVTRVGDGMFRARLDPAWDVFRGPNGGYVAAVALRALTETVDDPARRPRAFTTHFLRPTRSGEEMEIETRVERRGRAQTNASARMTQRGELVALALLASSTPRPAPAFDDSVPPPAPGPDEIARPEIASEVPPIGRRWDCRWVAGAPPGGGSPEDPAEVVAWMGLPEGRPVDAPAAVALVDGCLPAVFRRLGHDVAVPTIDLTVHLRHALPYPPAGARPLLARFRSVTARDGFLEEDGEVWAPDGTLLAQSRQLAAMLPR